MPTTDNKTNKINCLHLLDAVQNPDVKSFKLHKTVEESIVMLILNLADAINKRGDIHCQRYGITIQQYLILLHLAGDPNIEYIQENETSHPIVASELAEALNVSRPNITNVLNLLIVKNLVEQVRVKGDWRKKSLMLTEEGWTLIAKMEPYRRRTNRCLLGHLSETDKSAFLHCVQKSLDLLVEKGKP